jgi:hypothetical protein
MKGGEVIRVVPMFADSTSMMFELLDVVKSAEPQQ